MQPYRKDTFHWTDSKIRCHLLTCVIALTVLRILEIKVNHPGRRLERLSGETIIEVMEKDGPCTPLKRQRRPRPKS